jgi:hypothetical protein
MRFFRLAICRSESRPSVDNPATPHVAASTSQARLACHCFQFAVCPSSLQAPPVATEGGQLNGHIFTIIIASKLQQFIRSFSSVIISQFFPISQDLTMINEFDHSRDSRGSAPHAGVNNK